MKILKITYFQGPFKNEFGLADAGKMAPVDMQPDAVLVAITKHTLSADYRKEARAELDARAAQRNDPETKTRPTRDSWGHPGTCTYRRGPWGLKGKRFATVTCSDTSTGHGWQGIMSREEWAAI